REWDEGTRVALSEGCRLVVPVRGGGVVLVRNGQLEAELAPDAAHPWTLGMLSRIERSPGLTTAELAAGAMADEAVVTSFLRAMEDAGWVRSVDGPRPGHQRAASS
ncbi:MAG: MarR family transcriptional regulator, partial [Actinomycetota bacterium]|nr:MarR family transcriptional regulator [Actinomycetota bacterium]